MLEGPDYPFAGRWHAVVRRQKRCLSRHDVRIVFMRSGALRSAASCMSDPLSTQTFAAHSFPLARIVMGVRFLAVTTC